jgi:muconolactone D-isomerase
MQFLLDITVSLPSDLPEAQRQALMRAERVRGQELVQAGTIRDIWRIPGALRNVAIWQAPDATELHELITSLPLYRYCHVTVTPLATHPLQAGPEAGPHDTPPTA